MDNENNTSPTREELIDCIKNLMGVFDTPIARRKLVGVFIEEVREHGRKILSKLKDNE